MRQPPDFGRVPEAVVQAGRPALPELELFGTEEETSPARRPGNFGSFRVLVGDFTGQPFEFIPVLEGPALR